MLMLPNTYPLLIDQDQAVYSVQNSYGFLLSTFEKPRIPDLGMFTGENNDGQLVPLIKIKHLIDQVLVAHLLLLFTGITWP
jgi:hypothetical protein